MKKEILLLGSNQEILSIFPERKIRQFRIESKRIAVVRLEDTFYAFDNHCPHQDYPLDEGNINMKKEVICPWHGYAFNLRSGNESMSRCKGLKLYPVRINESNELVLLLS
ncbi:MAG: Rieske (2Fe-2S) protein [Cyclobacteriaceae bacterium]